MDVGSAGDPQFSFVLCRTGTNKNGDHFTAEELSGRHMTAVNKKVDLQHSQEFNDIVVASSPPTTWRTTTAAAWNASASCTSTTPRPPGWPTS
jgi:hypothetical protein